MAARYWPPRRWARIWPISALPSSPQGEARAVDAYKQMIVEGKAADIVYSNLFTGVHGNYLKGSVRNAGMDPDNLPESDPTKMSFASDSTKAWKDIWGCGQGIGAVDLQSSVRANWSTGWRANTRRRSCVSLHDRHARAGSKIRPRPSPPSS